MRGCDHLMIPSLERHRDGLLLACLIHEYCGRHCIKCLWRIKRDGNNRTYKRKPPSAKVASSIAADFFFFFFLNGVQVSLLGRGG